MEIPQVTVSPIQTSKSTNIIPQLKKAVTKGSESIRKLKNSKISVVPKEEEYIVID